MRVIVVLPQELVGDWLVKFSDIFDNIEFFTNKDSSCNLYCRFLKKISAYVFGESKNLKLKQEYYFPCIEDLKKIGKVDLLINFSISDLSNVFEARKSYQFKIDNDFFTINNIIGNSLKANPFISLRMVEYKYTVKTTELSLDKLNLGKNIDVILDTCLSQIKNGFTKKKRQISDPKSENTAVSILLLLKYLYFFINKFIKYSFFNEQWVLGYKFDNNKLIGYSPDDLTLITPPKDRFWADPIAVEYNNKYYIFIEELLFNKPTAHLSVFELKRDGSYTNPVKILEKPYHLSYPFVFHYNDEFYMIPETSKDNNVQLYKSIDFPYNWKYQYNLVDNIKASDTTLLEFEGKWWLFTSTKDFEFDSYDNNLKIYYSDSPLSQKWSLLETNRDSKITRSRMGGNFFKYNNKVYRVSQNSSYNYGSGYNVTEITALSNLDFQEETVFEFTSKGSKGIHGMHTYSVANDLVVCDILKYKSKL